MRINIYCEGDTEKGLDVLLAPVREQLRGKGLSLNTRPLANNSQLLRKIGNLTKNEISLGAPAVFCLIDLYNIYGALPQELARILANRNWAGLTVERRLHWLRTNIPRHCIDEEFREKFHIHFAVYEIEALIFADPGKIKTRLGMRSIKSYINPEGINDMNSPANKLNELFRTHSKKRKYIKTVDGVKLLSSLDFNLVYQKCPNFAAFVDDILSIQPR